MYQFFVEEEQVHSDSISITGGDVNHIKNVLRMKNGEKIRVSSKSGQAYFCHISSILDDEVIAAIDSADETGTELDNHIVLYQGLPKGDKMELIIQKAVELGVSEIVPVAMKNCVVKLDEKKALKKLQRWQAIAESAAKQSKRTVISCPHSTLILCRWFMCSPLKMEGKIASVLSLLEPKKTMTDSDLLSPRRFWFGVGIMPPP